MKNAIRLGMLSAAVMFSVGAFAATVEIKPVEIKPVEVKPLTPVQTNGKTSSGLNFGQMNKAKAANSAVTCSTGGIAKAIYDKIAPIAPDVTLADVTANIEGGYNSIGNCGHALTDMKAEPLANEMRITTSERGCLSGQSPKGHPKRTECLVAANRDVLGLSQADATENQAALEKCGYNN
jgi:hypothetical protein